ncbi:MAG: hypothetical protein U0176_16090 [Bacteroidia bacterium]
MLRPSIILPLLFLSGLLFAALDVACQSSGPHLTLHADIGACRTYVNYYDAYASDYRKNHSSLGLSASLRLPISRTLSFDPEIGVNAYGMTFFYSNSTFRRRADSELVLGYAFCSPMLAWNPDPHFGIATGFSVMASSFTLGDFAFWTFHNGPHRDILFKGHLGDVRNPVNWGPRLYFRSEFPTEGGHSLGFRIGSFLNLNQIFVKSLGSPFNPRFIQVFAGFTYCLTKSPQRP